MRSKKGVIFTMIAILFVGVMISSTIFLTKNSLTKKSFITTSRVTSMNDFILSIEQDIERSMIISGYRTIISLQKIVAENATFISDFDGSFEEIFINGTKDGVVLDLMNNASINSWISRINFESEKVNIIFDFKPLSISVYHESPWGIIIELNGTVNISDTNNLANWYYNKTFRKDIDITSFEDPLYTVKSFDKVTNIIIMANYSDFVDLSNNDTSILYYHLNNSRYVESSSGPSFLMRFSGNLSASPFGIESLVNVIDFSKQDLVVYNKSMIDYEYFDNTYIDADKCDFVNMPSWFRLDASKVESYNLTGLGSDCS